VALWSTAFDAAAQALAEADAGDRAGGAAPAAVLA
jgi:hypothetical protein